MPGDRPGRPVASSRRVNARCALEEGPGVKTRETKGDSRREGSADRAALVRIDRIGPVSGALCSARRADGHRPCSRRRGGHARSPGMSRRRRRFPGPLSESSTGTCEEGCCTVLAFATATPLSSPDLAHGFSPMPEGVDLYQVHAGLDRLSHSRQAERLKLPFRFRNPPLLI